MLKDNFIDVIVCLEGYEHVDKNSQSEFIKEAKRVLKNNGLIILTVPLSGKNGSQTGNVYHIYEPSKSEIKNVLDSNFKEIFTEYVHIPECEILRYVGQKR